MAVLLRVCRRHRNPCATYEHALDAGFLVLAVLPRARPLLTYSTPCGAVDRKFEKLADTKRPETRRQPVDRQVPPVRRHWKRIWGRAGS